MSAAVKDHNMLVCDHLIVSIDGFKMLATNDLDFHVKVKESILISRDEPTLTEMKRHYLFTYLIDPSHIYYCYSCCINITIVI